MKKSAIKTFALITRKHLCWSLFLIVLQTFRPATLLKKDSILKNISERLLLKIYPVLLF